MLLGAKRFAALEKRAREVAQRLNARWPEMLAIHRDVKLENMLLREDPSVLLCVDFECAMIGRASYDLGSLLNGVTAREPQCLAELDSLLAHLAEGYLLAREGELALESRELEQALLEACFVAKVSVLLMILLELGDTLDEAELEHQLSVAEQLVARFD